MKDKGENKNRKTYTTPKLIEYGSIHELTRNMATGSFADTGNKMAMA